MPKTNTAFLVDLRTQHVESIQISGYGDIRRHFSCDIRGETLRQLGETVYLRCWTSIDRDSERRVAIYDAYAVPSLKSVDLPAAARPSLEIAI
jgi:hypothetical protein